MTNVDAMDDGGVEITKASMEEGRGRRERERGEGEEEDKEEEREKGREG